MCTPLFGTCIYGESDLFILEEEVRESQGHQAKAAEDYFGGKDTVPKQLSQYLFSQFGTK